MNAANWIKIIFKRYNIVIHEYNFTQCIKSRLITIAILSAYNIFYFSHMILSYDLDQCK
jgi:hypothetical protein